MEFAGRVEERSFSFELTVEDRKDLEEPFDTASENAERIEARMEEIGESLFRALFDGSPIRAELRERLKDTRIEVVSASGLPWELLRDPAKAGVLSREAQS